jgi:uncharacterized protein DUF1848
MIISASYKTDIPAFYGEWFLNRLNAGYCLMVHPYDRRKVRRVSLLREDVDGFVFWTKNLGPFIPKLRVVADRGFPFVIQYTINAYPRMLEYSVTDATRSIRHVKEVSKSFGAKTVVWRYDPIIISTETPADSHLEKFDWLASRLEGLTDEVVISFAQVYDKTARNMNAAAAEFGFAWHDPSDQAKMELAHHLSSIANRHGIRVTLCSQPHLLACGVGEAHCVDARRFEALTGRMLDTPLKGSRKECGCFQSVDVGDYDTCPHGCVYCYAVRNRKLAQRRFQRHDPAGEFLFTTETYLESAEPPLFRTK